MPVISSAKLKKKKILPNVFAIIFDFFEKKFKTVVFVGNSGWSYIIKKGQLNCPFLFKCQHSGDYPPSECLCLLLLS